MLTPLRRILAEEWILAILLVTNFIFFPYEIGKWIDLHRGIIITAGILLLTIINFYKGQLRADKDLLSLLFTAFVILQFCSALWAKNMSLVWPVAGTWLALFVLFINVRSLDHNRFTNSFWRTLLYSIILCNTAILLGFLIYVGTQGPATFSLSPAKIHESFTYITYNNNFISTILLISIPVLIRLSNDVFSWKTIFLLIIQILLIVLLSSRAIAFGLLLIGLLYLIIYWKAIPKLKIAIVIGILAVFSAIIVSLAFEDPKQFLEKNNPFLTVTEKSGDERVVLWKYSYQLFSDVPVNGIGAGNWKTQYLKYGMSEFPNYKGYISAHNLAIQTLSELGIIGLLLILGLMLYPPISLIPALRTNTNSFCIFAIILASLVAANSYGVAYCRNGNFSSIQIAWIISISLALPYKKDVTIGKFLSILLLAVSFALLLWNSFLCRQNSKFESYVKHVSAGDKNFAVEILNEIYKTNIYEFRWNKHLLGYAAPQMFSLGDTENGIRTMQTAINRSPNEYRAWMHLGNMYYSTKRHNDAIEAYTESLRLNGKWYESAFGLARSALEIGDDESYAIGMNVYHNQILPIIDKYYNDKHVKPDNPVNLQYWERILRIKEKFERLEQKKEVRN